MIEKPNNAMLFGIPGDDLEAAKHQLEALLGISMDLFTGKSYTWNEYVPETDSYLAKVTVSRNLTSDGGEHFRWRDCPDLPLLIEVYDVEDQDPYEKAILSDPELKATRLLREVYRDGPDGEVIVDEF